MIFYLSCTGNTRWAARRLASATGERLIFIPDAIHASCTYTLEEGEAIGFCFPVHGWRPPLLVRQFVSRLHFTESPEGHYAFALCTAGDTTGETMDIFKKDLQQIPLELNATCALVMPESYVGLPFMDVDKPANVRRKVSDATSELNAFCQAVTQRFAEDGPAHIGRWKQINSRILGAGFLKLVSDKKFHVNSQACVKCGICADVCPVHDIEGGLGLEPKWLHNGSCLTCFACYHHCPHHAIEFGHQTQRKGQYFFEKYMH